MVSRARPGTRGRRPGGCEASVCSPQGPKGIGRRPPTAREVTAAASGGSPPAALWVGADAVKVLAGPALTSLAYSPPGGHTVEDLNPEGQEKVKGGRSDDAVRAHESRAAVALRQQRPVAALAELEAALCLCEKRGLETPPEIVRRWQTLTASAVAWSLDFLADAGLSTEWNSGAALAASDQALEMLCLAEMLTRKEVAENFTRQNHGSRLFFRALAHAGLGTYYQLRQKPRAAIRFLEQAATGHARWAHPAVLLNLSAAHSMLKEPGLALGVLDRAILSLRSATGRLCGEDMSEVDAAAAAAKSAVAAVLGDPVRTSEDTDRIYASADVDSFEYGLSLGRDLLGKDRVAPGFALDTPEDSRSLSNAGSGTGMFAGGSGAAAARMRAGTPGLRRNLAQHGLVSRVQTPRGQDVYDYEADAAVARTLLVAKVLLWPWPEFKEQEALASGALAGFAEPSADAGTDMDLESTLAKLAAPSIAQHASKLKKSWPQWGKMLLAGEAPGAGLVLRECLLLCFLHAATVLGLLCSQAAYSQWVIPPLREGLALAIVLFGPKHPLALKLINACQRVQRKQCPVPEVPSQRPGSSHPARRVPAPPGNRGNEPCQGRKPKTSAPAVAVSGGAAGKSRSSSQTKSRAASPAPNSRQGSQPAPAQFTPRKTHMHKRPYSADRQMQSKDELRHLRAHAADDLRIQTRPNSAALPISGGGLGRRLHAHASDYHSIGKRMGAPQSMSSTASLPTTPRSRSASPGPALQLRPSSTERQQLWPARFGMSASLAVKRDESLPPRRSDAVDQT